MNKNVWDLRFTFNSFDPLHQCHHYDARSFQHAVGLFATLPMAHFLITTIITTIIISIWSDSLSNLSTSTSQAVSNPPLILITDNVLAGRCCWIWGGWSHVVGLLKIEMLQ